MNFLETKGHRRVPGLKEQAAKLCLLLPGFSYEVLRGELIGQGKLRPHHFCDEYVFEVRYRVNFSPNITILYPKLRTRDGEPKPPHTYDPDQPCVFRPSVDWSSEMYLADTVIPWLAMWLFFYEIWLATGEWIGEGEHP